MDVPLLVLGLKRHWKGEKFIIYLLPEELSTWLGRGFDASRRELNHVDEVVELKRLLQPDECDVVDDEVVPVNI
jgi:hypothetical protein